jgi:hypothetical protein
MNTILSDVDLDDVEEICNESLWTDICTRKEELFSFLSDDLLSEFNERRAHKLCLSNE